ncbi:autophagy-related protein 17 [Dichotomopilus funicola]|uniref:Autophagy-related protein 17 n=1 Tax=Dichotomopilus funicola TaxID=1934379 RepID=A0AAN6ZML7_9PEZI|nr:autophagy-related protein 17 [Dichotomopilus funicola]
MAASRPASSAEPRSRPTSYHDPPSPGYLQPEDIPVEVLVGHLLAAKQSLSSMALVLRANDLATHAHQMHEESVILDAQTKFLRRLIDDETQLLQKLRRGMGRAYDVGRYEFKQLIRTLDASNEKLEKTLRMMQDTRVEAVFRPAGEEQKFLVDFIDENSVEAMRNTLKESIAELQAAQTSFDGDLLRLDNDLRLIAKTLSPPTSSDSPSASATYQPIAHLLASLAENSEGMAQHLTSLTTHFDMCVKAVRATEGGAALARRRAAEATDDGDPVSISGVITEQESHVEGLEPMDPQELAEIIQVVVEDAPEVDEVVAEIQAALLQMEQEFGALKDQADRIRDAWLATLRASQILEDIGARLQSYVAAEHEFVQRCEAEKDIIFGRLEEMDGLKRFYEGYASAYSSLLLEVERRRAVEDRIQHTLRKARDNVENLVEADRKQREHFRQEVGEFLPTDLWVGMNNPLKRWELTPVVATAEGGASISQDELVTPTATQPGKGKAPAR